MLSIAITADPYIPVPPRLYGGIERIVDFLVRRLVERGHDVTLFAHPESRVPARVIPYGIPPHYGLRARLGELWQVGNVLWRRRREFDVVHSFGRLAALLPVLGDRRLAKLQSYQRNDIPWKSVRRAVCLAGSSIKFSACAAHMFASVRDQRRQYGDWRAIFNGVELSRYDFRPSVPSDAPLVFLGRLEPIKGVHHAIAVARMADRPLIIAGNRVDSREGIEYFDSQIAPHLDGQYIQYIGPVDDGQKNKLLGSAAALLMLIDWDEPFGIVMAEAMACGTPVIGFARGSVPEVVRGGVNGFVCHTTDAAAAAVRRLDEIDRQTVRDDCEARFGDSVIVDEYERLYAEMASVPRPSPTRGTVLASGSSQLDVNAP